MYWNYHIIKILENFFQNKNLFLWIKLISILLHFSYWYYNIASLELLCLTCHLCQISPWLTETPLQYIFFIGFPILSYPIRQHATIPGCTKAYAKPSQQIYYQAICKSLYLIGYTRYLQKFESLRAASLSKLDNTVNNNSIFNTDCADSFFYTSALFPIFQYYFCVQQSLQSTSKAFYLPQLCQGTNEQESLALPQNIDRDNRAHNHWFLIAQAQKIGVLEVVVFDEDGCSQNGKLSNPPPSSIPLIYLHYFHTLPIPSPELTFPYKRVVLT